MEKRNLCMLLLFMLFCFGAIAQNKKTVTGVVKDDKGDFIPGVSIVLKGTSVGSITDTNGEYTLKVEKENAVLVFSFIGFLPQEIPVNGRGVINVELKPDVVSLDEVVAIGYGTARKSDLSGASVTVSSEKLQSTISTSLDQAIQGHVAGLTVTQTSGTPGSSTSLRIRGTSTLNSDAEPLYVIDGVPMETSGFTNGNLGTGLAGNGKSLINPLASLNPSDVESIEVLKDASATAIYGSRGANGVILITTKNGQPGEAKFSYEGYYGVQEVVKTHDMLNLQQYAQYSNEVARAGYTTPVEEFGDPSALGNGTDWQDALYRVAPMHSHQMSASGGTEKSRYAISAGYFDQEGIVQSSDFRRFSTRLKIDSDLNDWLKLTATGSYTNIDQVLGQHDGEGVIGQTLSQTPDIPIKNFDGSWANGVGENVRQNPLMLLEMKTNELKRNNFSGKMGVDVKLLDCLTFHTEAGGNIGFNNAVSFVPMYDFGKGAVNKENSLSRTRSQNSYWQMNQLLTFSKKFGDHSVTVMVGHEASEWTWETLSGGASALPTNTVFSLDLGDATSMSAGSSKSSGALESYFGRATYGYKDRYNLTATVRQDGSSNFGPNYRWATFPSFAASWRISNEPFMEAFDFVNNMKIRTGWGVTGNQNIAPFSYSVSMGRLPTNLGSGMRPSNYANPNVRWEESEQLNVGVDMRLFEHLLDVTVDLYQKTSKDMLMEYPFPAYMGGVGNDAFRLRNPVGNFGEISNKGIEVAITVHPFTNKNGFSWDIDAVYSMNKNELVDLGLENASLDGNIQWHTLVSRVNNGEAIGSFYGYEVAGVFQDKEDILNSPRQYQVDGDGNPVLNRQNTVWVGDLKFRDINGDLVIDEKDRTYLGSPQPDFTGSLRNTFRYKGVDLSFFLTGSYGNKIYNYVRQGRDGLNGLDDMTGLNRNQLTTVLDAAQLVPINGGTAYPDDEEGVAYMDDIDNVRVGNPGTTMPRISLNDPNNNIRVSDRYIEDGSYLRISNITLGYTLPKEFVRTIHLSNLRVYGRIQNVYTFTNYTGLDPEIGQDAMVNTLYGVDNHRYPSPRIYTFGLNLNF